MGVVISLDIGCASTTVNTNFTSSSSAIFKLQHITSLDFSACSLQGVIPSSIGNLSQLTYLSLSHNHLVGEIPASLGNLNQVINMYLYDNDLTGNIPTSFTNLTKLSGLYLRENQFKGGLDLVLPNLTSLSALDLSSNHFQSSIFPYLSTLHNLELFYGSDNSFDGSFPSSLLGISSLIKLRLSHNNFSGEVPNSISKLPNLTLVDLSNNKLEGQVPQYLWKSSNLEYVYLSHNTFNSFGDSVEVIDGASLLELRLASNLFQPGPLPLWICKLRFLESLDLSNNRFTGSIPKCLNHFKHLSLNLRNNNLSGFIPDFCIHGSLKALELSHNNLVGKLPRSLTNCTGMEFLNVKGNKIKDTFPFWLDVQSLIVLVLGTNAFYDPVYNPSSYFQFQRLWVIDISNNNFVGSFPQDYFASWPDMSQDHIGDESYPELSYLNNYYLEYDSINLVYKGVDTYFSRVFIAFRAIDFSGNQFFGHIPKSIGLMNKLCILNLSGNTFTGNIPPSLANITTLEILDLSQNNLLINKNL